MPSRRVGLAWIVEMRCGCWTTSGTSRKDDSPRPYWVELKKLNCLHWTANSHVNRRTKGTRQEMRWGMMQLHSRQELLGLH